VDKPRRCSVAGCEHPHAGHSFCKAHLKRWHKHGHPCAEIPLRQPLGIGERFLAKTFIMMPLDCWESQTSMARGYGQFALNGGLERAHRAAWMIFNGPIPDGLSVLHHCDNRRCVNLQHLFLGTAGDNARDAQGKGILYTKVTATQVAEIRRRYEAGDIGMRPLALEFGISRSQIQNIVRGRSWQRHPNHASASTGGQKLP
jgi:hypothetical protein